MVLSFLVIDLFGLGECSPFFSNGSERIEKNATPFHLHEGPNHPDPLQTEIGAGGYRRESGSDMLEIFFRDWDSRLAEEIAYGFARVVPSRVFKI